MLKAEVRESGMLEAEGWSARGELETEWKQSSEVLIADVGGSDSGLGTEWSAGAGLEGSGVLAAEE